MYTSVIVELVYQVALHRTNVQALALIIACTHCIIKQMHNHTIMSRAGGHDIQYRNL